MKGEWIRAADNGVAVIFVHGVLSNGEACWTNPNGTYWPKLLREEPTLDGVGIYVFTYLSTISSASYGVPDAATFLKAQMRLDKLFDCRTLIFVAHSMGGLVVRKLLVERAGDFRDAGVSVGLFLLASPSMGSRYANLLAPIARLMGHTQAAVLRAGPENAWLMDLNREFTNLKEGRTLALFGKELSEDRFIKLPLLIRRAVVGQDSVERFFGEPLKIPGSDHFSIAKPDSAGASQHRELVQFIEERPMSVQGNMALDPTLANLLQRRLVMCSEAKLAFRTYHKLLALFEMPGTYTRACFDAAEAGTSSRVENWLCQNILEQAANEEGQESQGVTLEDDATVQLAMAMAWQQRAKTVNERHLLLTILADRHSGTMEAIMARLGEAGIAKVRDTARLLQPQATRMQSRVVGEL